jgi:hypothetical protein
VIKAFVLAEGQTEETFLRDLVSPHLASHGLHLTPVLASTKRVKSGHKFRGGVVSYRQVETDLRPLLADSSAAVVTTMIDYYRLPADFPGMADRPASPHAGDHVAHLEEALRREIDSPRFEPFFCLHEFEALLFADTSAILDRFQNAKNPHLLEPQAAPEEVNDGEATHPAARIQAVAPGYRKALHGPMIAKTIGLARIRQRCPRFDRWVSLLESRGG